MRVMFDGPMKLYAAPLDADSPDSWHEIGYTDDLSLTFEGDTVLDAQATLKTPEGPSLLDMIKDVSVQLEAQPYRPSEWWGPPFDGLKVYESEYVPPSSMFISATGLGSIYIPQARLRRATPLEQDGERAKRIVRHGLADVLRWLGEEVGPHPDDVDNEERWIATIDPVFDFALL